MSRINDENKQLNIAFNDSDLVESKHDQIMLWLDVLARDPANFINILNAKWETRSEGVSHCLDAPSRQLVKTLPEHHQSAISRRLHEMNSAKTKSVSQPWQNEPVPTSKFIHLQWEHILWDREGARGRVGYCDLLAVYSVNRHLTRNEIITHQLNARERQSATRSEHKFWDWELQETGREREFSEHSVEVKVFFEVKSKIRSIGELMRQIQTYKSTHTFRSASYNDLAKFVVVAPPNNEVQSVCASHGINFLPYVTTKVGE